MYILKVYSTCYTWDKTQMLKKILLHRMNGTKNALVFLSRAPAHQFSFEFVILIWAEAQGSSL